jgi:HSP20 family protein
MITRWDPFVDFARLSNDLFAFAEPARSVEAQRFVPAVDVEEEKDAIVVRAELPGLKAEDVKIDLDKNVLTLSGERRLDKAREKEGFRRIERRYGSFARSFALPETVDGDNIDASLTDGVLTVRIPKRPNAVPRKIAVKASA